MNRAIIFLNGDKSSFSGVSNYIDGETFLIGCDGGAEKIIELGLRPDIIIGDFDSISQVPPSGIKTIKHPKDKDYTDSQAAIRYALDQGAKEVILAGFLGGRIDHMLGNIYLLDKPEFSEASIKIIDGNQEIYLMTGEIEVKGAPGEIISFIPIFGDVQAEFSSGLKYNLAKYLLSMKGNSGISNEMTADTAEVRINEQKLLVIHTKKK